MQLQIGLPFIRERWDTSWSNYYESIRGWSQISIYFVYFCLTKSVNFKWTEKRWKQLSIKDAEGYILIELWLFLFGILSWTSICACSLVLCTDLFLEYLRVSHLLPFYLTPAIMASINTPPQQRGICFPFQVVLSSQTVLQCGEINQTLEHCFFCWSGILPPSCSICDWVRIRCRVCLLRNPFFSDAAL